MPITQLSAQQLQQRLQNNEELVLLDVREANEFAYASIAGSMHVPLRDVPGQLNHLNPEQDIVVICHHGMRSQHACLFLEQYGYQQLFNLHGGIDAWSLYCDSTVSRY